MASGFAPGDTASILSNTVVEWVLADLAVLSCGGVSNGIYPTDAASQVAVPVRRLAHHASCSWKTTSSSTRRWKCASGCRGLRKIVVFDMEGLRDLRRPAGVISLEALRALGREYRARRIPTS